MTENRRPEPDETDLEDYPITDAGGYLPCGCLGTDRDHTCAPRRRDRREHTRAAMENTGRYLGERRDV
jgi:hypothetical protein